jgi:ABC-2 type transport system permease protein
MSRALQLLLHEWKFDVRTTQRDPQSRFFTIALPIIFIAIFGTVFGSTIVTGPPGLMKATRFYTGSLITFAIVGTAFVNLCVAMTTQREAGILERRRATPVPTWVLIVGRLLTVALVTVAIVVLLLLFGWLAYGVRVPASGLLGVIVATIVGTASFCCIGFGVFVLIRSAESALPISQVLSLPLYFISGVFFAARIPGALKVFSDLLPIRHLNDAVLYAIGTGRGGTSIEVGQLAIVAAWGAVLLVVAIVRFRWAPQGR